MFNLEVNDAIVVQQRQVLEQALSTNPNTQRALQQLIREVIREARQQVVDAAGDVMDSDPREARRAVRTIVYRKVLGANINIYNSRRSHGSTSYEPPRNPSLRGGNRMKRSERTARMMSYAAQDRGMILRWLNEGTRPRVIGFRNGLDRFKDTYAERLSIHGAGETAGTWFRGEITARNWFRGAAERALRMAADNLANLIDNQLTRILKNEK